MNTLDKRIVESHKNYPDNSDKDQYVECQICS